MIFSDPDKNPDHPLHRFNNRLFREKEKRKSRGLTLRCILKSIKCGNSDSFDLAGTQAGSTYMHSLRCAVHNNTDFLHIGFPDLICSSVRVAHLDSEMSTFSANITFCHIRTSFFQSPVIKSQRMYDSRRMFELQAKVFIFSTVTVYKAYVKCYNPVC